MKDDIDSSVLGLLDRLKKEKDRELLKEVNFIVQICVHLLVNRLGVWKDSTVRQWFSWLVVMCDSLNFR